MNLRPQPRWFLWLFAITLGISGILALKRGKVDYGYMDRRSVSGVQANLLGIVWLVAGVVGIVNLLKRK